MIARLAAARDLLRSSLDQYLNVCLAVDNFYVTGFSPEEVLSELTDDITNELAQSPLYEETLLKAKAALASARNRSIHVAPVSRLPTDVLVRIFQLVTADDNCSARDQKQTNKHVFPRHPGLLTQVCSKWRQVVLACTYLWSHIDIPSPVSRDEAILSRMKKYIARSGVSLLDVHIVEVENPEMHAPISLHSLARVLAPLSPRVRSLDLDLSSAPTLPFGPLASSGVVGYSMMLSTCFSSCTAGTLGRLSIRSSNPDALCSFIAAAFSDPRKNSRFFTLSRETVVSVSVPEKVLESLWLPVTVLELRGFYPRWESNAYHGLVELRLGTPAENSITISEAEFLKVLSSSPRLRVLDFGIKIADTSLLDDDLNPVRLEDLEILVTGERTPEELGHFLRLIAPGPHPLRISLRGSPGRYSGLLGLEIQKFFARSNVEVIGVASRYTYPQLLELLDQVPDARALVLSRIHFERIDWTKYELACAESRLQDLYILRYTMITEADLVRMIKAHRIRRLVVAEDCAIVDTSGFTIPFGSQTLREKVSSLGVSLELVPSGEPHPVREWDWSF